jgi:hypothetical protein
MAVISPVSGKFMGRLAKAAGIDFPVSRLVIECDAASHAKLYIVAPANLAGFHKVCEEFEAIQVESVAVQPDASLTVVPLAAPNA